MKKINIFLASSLIEFEKERALIENFIRNVSDRFEDMYNIKIQPLLCENFDDAYTEIRKQEEYNQKIRGSDFCFFIFFTKVGKYTREEFDVARKQFEKCGKPKIYTYFKKVENATIEQSIYDFMEELDNRFGHYYGSFSHIDTIKLRIILTVVLSELDSMSIKITDKECVIGEKIGVDISNVSEFANNYHLLELQEELAYVEENYYALKVKYEKYECNTEECKKYSNVASKRQSLINQINELRNSIFDVSIRMIKDDIHGEITIRQKNAYKLFEMGDYEGCMSILNSSEIDDEFLRERKHYLAACKKYIREHKTAIDILVTMTKYKKRFKEIEERYEKIFPVIIESKIELDTAITYVEYLSEQKQFSKACSAIEKLLPICDSANKARILNERGIIYYVLGQFEKAMRDFVDAIQIYEDLSEHSPKTYCPFLGTTYSNLALVYCKLGLYEETDKYCIKAMEMRKCTPSTIIDIADTCQKLGSIYMEKGDKQRAIKFFNKAKDFYEETKTENEKPFLYAIYCNLGALYWIEDYEKAQYSYLKAAEIVSELAVINPPKYKNSLISTCRNIAQFYEETAQFDMAKAYYLKMIEMINYFDVNNSENEIVELLYTYQKVGMLYQVLKLYSDAEYYFNEIIRLSMKVEDETLRNVFLLTCYSEIAVINDVLKNHILAEQNFIKSIEVGEQLVELNSEFKSDLITSYNNIIVFYKDINEHEKAEDYIRKIIELMGL